MSLDIDFYHNNPDFTGDYNNEDIAWDERFITDASFNITHNMNIMAEHVPLSNGSTLYQLLWRGEEMNPPIETADQMKDLLCEGLKYLAHHKENLLQYNPSNGWGNFDSLLTFTGECLLAAIKFPNDRVIYSR